MGNTPLHLAVRQDLFETATFLVNTCKVRAFLTNKMGNTALHVAVLNNRRQLAEMLIEAKVDVLLENKEGYTCHVHA